jgi:hypothetical protein
VGERSGGRGEEGGLYFLLYYNLFSFIIALGMVSLSLMGNLSIFDQVGMCRSN